MTEEGKKKIEKEIDEELDVIGKKLDDEVDKDVCEFIEDSKERTRIRLFRKSTVLYVILLSIFYIVSVLIWFIAIYLTKIFWMKNINFYYFVFLISTSLILSFVLFIFNALILYFVNKCYVERKIKKFGVNI